MAWEDKIELKVFDGTQIGANLIEWFKENQEDALIWANNGEAITGAKNILIQDFFPNARLITRFPAFSLDQMAFETDTGEDICETQIALRFEIAIAHGKEDWLAKYAPVYAMAFESMAKNIPITRLENNSIINFSAGALLKIETTFDLLKQGTNNYLQTFTTQINWLIEFSNK